MAYVNPNTHFMFGSHAIGPALFHLMEINKPDSLSSTNSVIH